jgi:hypothetical protein
MTISWDQSTRPRGPEPDPRHHGEPEGAEAALDLHAGPI